LGVAAEEAAHPEDFPVKFTKSTAFAATGRRLIATTLREYLDIRGHHRVDNDPSTPSLSEAFQRFSDLVNYPAVEKKWTSRAQ
jgi:hypothetical protein